MRACALRLKSNDGWQHTGQQATRQVFGEQTDQIAAVVERSQGAAATGAAPVVGACPGLVQASPAAQLGAEREIDPTMGARERLRHRISREETHRARLERMALQLPADHPAMEHERVHRHPGETET